MRTFAVVTAVALGLVAAGGLRPGHQRRADRAHRRHRQPGRHRRRQARRVHGDEPEVKKFAQQMVTDHTGVNKQAVDLATKLKVTPEDNTPARASRPAARRTSPI